MYFSASVFDPSEINDDCWTFIIIIINVQSCAASYLGGNSDISFLWLLEISKEQILIWNGYIIKYFQIAESKY